MVFIMVLNGFEGGRGSKVLCCMVLNWVAAAGCCFLEVLDGFEWGYGARVLLWSGFGCF